MTAVSATEVLERLAAHGDGDDPWIRDDARAVLREYRLGNLARAAYIAEDHIVGNTVGDDYVAVSAWIRALRDVPPTDPFALADPR